MKTADATKAMIPTIYLDIETFSGEKPPLAPNPELEPTPSLNDIKPHGGIKDPVKQLEYKEEKQKAIAEANLAAYNKAIQANLDKQDKEWRSQSLDPFLGEIICVVLKVDEDDPFIITGVNEQELLEYLDIKLMDYSYPNIIAHFGLTFDFYFLFVKGLQYRMRNVASVFGGHGGSTLIDTATIIRGTNYKGMVSLDKMTYTLTGNKAKGDIHGSDVHDLYLDGRIEDICHYCVKDTLALYESCKVLEESGLL